MSNEQSLGDILKSAMERNTHDYVRNFVLAALKMGRTKEQVAGWLSPIEFTALITPPKEVESTTDVVYCVWMITFPQTGAYRGQKITAIKDVRELVTNTSLVDAKNFIEGSKSLRMSEAQLMAARVMFRNENLSVTPLA